MPVTFEPNYNAINADELPVRYELTGDELTIEEAQVILLFEIADALRGIESKLVQTSP